MAPPTTISLETVILSNFQVFYGINLRILCEFIMSMTRGKTKDLEANRQEGGSEAADNRSELTSKQSSFQSALKKLAYFDRSTVNTLRDGGQGKLDRQRKLLGTKLDECLDLIQDIQGIFIDLDEQEEAIDSWTNHGR